MSKHTPGPYVAAANHEGNIVISTADGMHVVAFIPVKNEPLPLEQHAANAALFAAAPELLAAAKLLAELPEAKWAIRWQPLIAAIAKAEGDAKRS